MSNDLTVINAVTLLPSTKSEADNFVKMVKSSILGGECNPLEMARQITIAFKVFDTLKSDEELKDYFLTEAEKYPEKEVKFNGAVFSKSSYKKYKFGAEITQKEEEIKRLKEIAKHIKCDFCDTETGEIITPAQLEIDKDILKITIK